MVINITLQILSCRSDLLFRNINWCSRKKAIATFLNLYKSYKSMHSVIDSILYKFQNQMGFYNIIPSLEHWAEINLKIPGKESLLQPGMYKSQSRCDVDGAAERQTETATDE